MTGLCLNCILHLVVSWVNFWSEGADTSFEFLPLRYYLLGLVIDIPVSYLLIYL